MDSQHHQEFPSTPPHLSTPLSPKPLAVYTYPKMKKRLRIKQTQIQDSPQQLQQPQEPATELVVYEKAEKARSNKQKRIVVNDFYENSETKPEIKSSAMERAEEIRSNLDSNFPSFAKALVRSNVTVGFWMHLPMKFCKMFLPKSDTTVFVETENGSEFVINYIAERTALSGGWKAFIGSNTLLEGDVLIFHLLKPLRFKVYIVRGNGSSAIEGDRAIQNGGVSEMQLHNEPAETEFETDVKVKNNELVPAEPLGENNQDNQENGLNELDNGKGQVPNEFTERGDDCGSENMQVVPSGGSNMSTEGMTGFEDFSILVNGLVIDSELSDHCRAKYYELCCSQNAFLHENLLNSINHKLAAEIISGTVNIAEAIRTCKLSGSGPDHTVWDKTLKGFELLGMNVGFLRARLGRIMSLAKETEKAVESEYKEIKREQDRVNEEMKSLELKVQKLKETREKLDTEIENLRSNAERHELMFQEVVNAPW